MDTLPDGMFMVACGSKQIVSRGQIAFSPTQVIDTQGVDKGAENDLLMQTGPDPFSEQTLIYFQSILWNPRVPDSLCGSDK